MLISWARFHHIRDNHPQRMVSEWGEFAGLFTIHKIAAFKEACNLFSMTHYKEKTLRGNNNIESMSGAVLDFDGKDENALTLEKVLPVLKSYTTLAYTTFSHTPEQPRFRVILPFAEAIKPLSYREAFFPALKSFLQRSLGSELKELDNSSERPAQIFYLPCAPATDYAVSLKNDAVFMLPDSFINEEHARKALDKLLPDMDYPEWIDVGMALKAGLGDAGLPIWNAWSSKGKKYNKEKGIQDLVDKWKSFNGNGINLGTLFYMAKYQPGDSGTPLLTDTPASSAQDSLSLADQILVYLKGTSDPLFPREIALGLGKRTPSEQNVVRVVLTRLYERGKVAKQSNGTYVLHISKPVACQNDARNTPVTPQEGVTPPVTPPQNGCYTPSVTTDLGITDTDLSVTEESKKWSNFRQFGNFDIFRLNHTPLLESIYDFFTSNCHPLLPHLALGATINVAGHLLRDVAVCRGKRPNFYTLLVARTGGGKDAIAKNINKLMEYRGWGCHLVSNFVSVQGYEKLLKEKDGTLFIVTDEAAQWFGSFEGKNTSEHYKKIKTALKLCYSGEPYSCQTSKEDRGERITRPFINCAFLGTPVIFQNIREADISDGLLGRMLVFHDTNDQWGVDADFLSRGIQFIEPKVRAIQVPKTPHELYAQNQQCLYFYQQFVESTPAPSSLPDNHTQYLLARLHENFNKLLLLTLNNRGETTLEAAMWCASVVISCYDTACSLIAKDFGKTSFSDALNKMLSLLQSSGSMTRGQLRAKHAMQRLDKRLFDEALQALEEMGCIETLTLQHASGGRPTTTIHITEKGRKEKPHD